MGRFTKPVLGILVLTFIGIQFIDVEKTNPPVKGDIDAPQEVKTILKKSCYDCHSNETKWPWYSNIAPVSWFIADDVNSGRRHLNFSDWENYNDVRQEKKMQEIWEEINKGEMPMTAYTYMHPGTDLDITQKGIIKKWVTGKGIGEL